MRMASGCGAQSVAERRVSSLNASPSSASQPKLRGLRSSARVNAAAGSRLRAVEPAQSNGVTSNGRRPQAGPKQKNGSRPTIPAIVTPLGPAEMDEEVSHKAPDRCATIQSVCRGRSRRRTESGEPWDDKDHLVSNNLGCGASAHRYQAQSRSVHRTA